MDCSSNLSLDLSRSTSPPVEKCSLNPRRGRKSNVQKRQLLTGFIIYASEVRKKVIDENPDQNFGDISRLVGNEWRDLPMAERTKYDKRALIHNKRVKEKALSELNGSPGGDKRLSKGFPTSLKASKIKSTDSPRQERTPVPNDTYCHGKSALALPQNGDVSLKSKDGHQLQQQSNQQSKTVGSSKKSNISDSSTQTNTPRIINPPTKKRLVYSDTFKKYLENLLTS